MRIRVDFWLPEDMVVELIAKIIADGRKLTKQSLRDEAREVMEGYGYQWSCADDIGSEAGEEHYEEAQQLYDRYARRWDL